MRVIIIFLITSLSYGQTIKTVNQVKIINSWGIGYIGNINSDNSNSITFYDKDNRIEIVGDTLKAIIILREHIDNLQKEHEDQIEATNRSVDYINSIPFYWNNKEYVNYIKAIRKVGFKSVKKKQPKKKKH